ncbi:MAG: CHAD domain-containing protein [Solirubrobacteraceae bacterium]
MGFRFDPTRPVADAARNVALERLDRIVRALEPERVAADPADAVHDARKDLKRLRSLVRLLRPGLAKADRRTTADTLRDVSRGLAARRDADALIETLDALGPASTEALGAEPLDRLRAALTARAAVPGADERADLTAAVDALRPLRERIALGLLDGTDADTLVAGLRRTYEQGSQDRATAEADPTAEHLHEWRKRAKDLWYQQQLIADAWPAVLTPLYRQARELAQRLGDDHDLSELARVLRDPDGPAADAEIDPEALLELVAARRTALLVVVHAHGDRVYAERPGAFARRTAAWLRAPAPPD